MQTRESLAVARLATTLLAALALAFALLPASHAAAAGFVGMTADDLLFNAGPYRDTNLALQRQAGVQTLRVTFDWAGIEVAPNSFDFSNYDRYLREAAANGISILPVLYNPPAFQSSRPSGGARRGVYPPADFAAMGAWAARLVDRYGPNGLLWQGHPNPKPITAWQIWNEPPLPFYWPPKPNARRYLELLRVVGGAIKARDPSAEIVTAGLPDSRLRGAVRLTPFLKALYKGGGSSAFDTVAINSYAVNARYLGKLVGTTRKLMNRIGGRRDAIWITELGWCDNGPKHRFCVGSKGQAKNISASLKLIKKRRRAWKLHGFVLFSWRDAPRLRPDEWGYHTGLLTNTGRKKPAFKAFTRGVRGL